MTVYLRQQQRIKDGASNEDWILFCFSQLQGEVFIAKMSRPSFVSLFMSIWPASCVTAEKVIMCIELGAVRTQKASTRQQDGAEYDQERDGLACCYLKLESNINSELPFFSKSVLDLPSGF